MSELERRAKEWAGLLSPESCPFPLSISGVVVGRLLLAIDFHGSGHPAVLAVGVFLLTRSGHPDSGFAKGMLV